MTGGQPAYSPTYPSSRSATSAFRTDAQDLTAQRDALQLGIDADWIYVDHGLAVRTGTLRGCVRRWRRAAQATGWADQARSARAVAAHARAIADELISRQGEACARRLGARSGPIRSGGCCQRAGHGRRVRGRASSYSTKGDAARPAASDSACEQRNDWKGVNERRGWQGTRRSSTGPCRPSRAAGHEYTSAHGWSHPQWRSLLPEAYPHRWDGDASVLWDVIRREGAAEQPLRLLRSSGWSDPTSAAACRPKRYGWQRATARLFCRRCGGVASDASGARRHGSEPVWIHSSTRSVPSGASQAPRGCLAGRLSGTRRLRFAPFLGDAS